MSNEEAPHYVECRADPYRGTSKKKRVRLREELHVQRLKLAKDVVREEGNCELVAKMMVDGDTLVVLEAGDLRAVAEVDGEERLEVRDRALDAFPRGADTERRQCVCDLIDRDRHAEGLLELEVDLEEVDRLPAELFEEASIVGDFLSIERPHLHHDLDDLLVNLISRNGHDHLLNSCGAAK